MEFTIETGIAMPKSVRTNTKDATWVKAFKQVRTTVDILQPGQSFAFNTAKAARVKRDLTWILNKYGLHIGKRFVIVATEEVPGTADAPATPGNVRIFCTDAELPEEAYEAGNYAERVGKLFAEGEVAQVIVPGSDEEEEGEDEAE